MKRLPLYVLTILLAAVALNACNSDDDNTKLQNAYEQWRKTNESWLTEQQARKNPDGTPYFQTVVPSWNPGVYVLIHYFNDRAETAGNLVPMSTSTIDTRYIVHYCNGEPLDSSYNQTKYGPGIFRTRLDQVIQGWTVALETMHVGDTAEIVIPYQLAYGLSTTSNVTPYSNLRFNVRLVDIPYYETSPR